MSGEAADPSATAAAGAGRIVDASSVAVMVTRPSSRACATRARAIVFSTSASRPATASATGADCERSITTCAWSSSRASGSLPGLRALFAPGCAAAVDAGALRSSARAAEAEEVVWTEEDAGAAASGPASATAPAAASARVRTAVGASLAFARRAALGASASAAAAPPPPPSPAIDSCSAVPSNAKPPASVRSGSAACVFGCAAAAAAASDVSASLPASASTSTSASAPSSRCASFDSRAARSAASMSVRGAESASVARAGET